MFVKSRCHQNLFFGFFGSTHAHVTDKLLFKRPQPTLSSAHTHPSHAHTHIHASVTHRGNTHKYTPCRGELLRDTHTLTDTPGFHICLLSLPPSLNFYLLHSLEAIPAYNLSPRWRAGTSPQGGKKVCVCLRESVYTTQKWEMRLTARVTIMAPDVKVVGQEKVASQILNIVFCWVPHSLFLNHFAISKFKHQRYNTKI